MIDSKGCAGVRLWLKIVIIPLVFLMKTLDQGLICGLGKLGLFIDQGKDVHGLLSNHVQCCLVVHEGDLLPVDALPGVLLLLHLEDVLDEELLDVLIAVVDAELFKTVVIEILKSKNIQNTNGALVSTNF